MRLEAAGVDPGAILTALEDGEWYDTTTVLQESAPPGWDEWPRKVYRAYRAAVLAALRRLEASRAVERRVVRDPNPDAFVRAGEAYATKLEWRRCPV